MSSTIQRPRPALRHLALATISAAVILAAVATPTYAAPATPPVTSACPTVDGGHAPLATPPTKPSAHSIVIKDTCVYPESVAADENYIYTGNISNGAIYRGRIGSKTITPFLPAGQDGRTQATGIKLAGDRLLVAGAFTGKFFVYSKDGKLQSQYSVPQSSAKTLVNDATVAPNGDVYITDSFRPVLYRIPASEIHGAATTVNKTLEIAYHLPDYEDGVSNGNGIVTSSDGKSLIVGYWNAGALYRLTLATGEIHKIDAPALRSSDGIAHRGNTLYIARSVNNTAATLRLHDHDSRATLVAGRSYPGADTTTGIAVVKNQLVVSNSQMDTYLYDKDLTSPVFTLATLPLN